MEVKKDMTFSLKDLQVSSDVHKWRAQRGKYDKQCGRDLSVEAA